MLKIKEIYNNLGHDEEFVIQIKSKIDFEKIINQLKPIFKKDIYSDNFIFLRDHINHKTAYFILGNWRDGMFKLRVGKKDNDDLEIYILADTKEDPMSNIRHRKQIEDIINILDKYRNFIIIKKMKFDDNFDLVKKVTTDESKKTIL